MKFQDEIIDTLREGKYEREDLLLLVKPKLWHDMKRYLTHNIDLVRSDVPVRDSFDGIPVIETNRVNGVKVVPKPWKLFISEEEFWTEYLKDMVERGYLSD